MLPDCYMIQDGDQIRGGVPDSNGNEVFQIVEIDVTAVSLKGMNYTPETEGSTGEPTTECYVGFSQSDALAGCYDTQSVETRLSIIDASL